MKNRRGITRIRGIARRKNNGFAISKGLVFSLFSIVAAYYTGKLVGYLSGMARGVFEVMNASPRILNPKNTELPPAMPRASITSSEPGFLYIDGQPVGIIPQNPEVATVVVQKPGTYVFNIKYLDGKSSGDKQVVLEVPGYSSARKLKTAPEVTLFKPA
jgi:hypothetical protein